MSYEGQDWFILENKTLVKKDCYDMVVPEGAAWYAHINETNGYDEDDIFTHTPKLKDAGFLDDWKVDHYGNKYAEKILLYEPDNGEGNNPWKRIEKEITE